MRDYKCMNIKPETDRQLKELAEYLRVSKVQLARELIQKLYEYFKLFKPRPNWKLDYDIEVTNSRLIIEFSGFPSTIVAGMARNDEERKRQTKEQFKLRGLE